MSCDPAGDPMVFRLLGRTRSRTWFVVLVASGLLCAGAPAAGQVAVDVGVHTGVACLNGGPGCEGSFVGPLAALEWNGRVALRIRHFAADVGDRSITSGHFTIRTQDRRGQLLLWEFLYKFRRPSRIQPFVGLSVGHRSFRSATTCVPVSCAEVNAIPGGLRVADGVVKNSRATVGGITGVAFHANERVTIQTMFGIHDPWQEHGETVEGALVLSIAVWRRR